MDLEQKKKHDTVCHFCSDAIPVWNIIKEPVSILISRPEYTVANMKSGDQWWRTSKADYVFSAVGAFVSSDLKIWKLHTRLESATLEVAPTMQSDSKEFKKTQMNVFLMDDEHFGVQHYFLLVNKAA